MTSKVPPCPLVTISYANESPKPVPSPVGLVVKKGWKILAFTLSDMPMPLSLTRISISPPAPKEGVTRRVTDNGNGIPESVKAKVFQPFFTTKPAGEGTGLGLSLSYDIVTKGHGGTLEVISTEGVGSEFIIHLPLIK